MKKLATVALLPVLAFGLTGCSGASKDAVRQGVVNMQGQSAVEGDMKARTEKYAQCVVDKVYDDLSSDSRSAIAEVAVGGSATIVKEDHEKFEAAQRECSEKINKEMQEEVDKNNSESSDSSNATSEEKKEENK
ncbi:MAG: hypothetical protein J6M18_00515 [Actinomycetaceae bacterium]|nr:hypothetical protein [Actinomycetaceae bacterium]